MPDQILVVEDDRELRDLLTDVLRDAGYRATSYASAGAALEGLAGGTPTDLVITDLMMPGMRGTSCWPKCGGARPS